MQHRPFAPTLQVACARLVLLASIGFLAWLPASGAFAGVDVEIVDVNQLQRITVGNASEEEVLELTIRDNGRDGLPAILTGLVLRGEIRNTTAFVGADLSISILSEDVTGGMDPERFEPAAQGSGAIFDAEFSEDPLLFVPDGASRIITVIMRYNGSVSGDFPDIGPLSENADRGIFLSADAELGGFRFASSATSSQLNTDPGNPELGPAYIDLRRASLRVDPLPLPVVSVGDTLGVRLSLVDSFGAPLEDVNDTITLNVDWRPEFFGAPLLASVVGPVNGEFIFEGANALDFTNTQSIPLGEMAVRFFPDSVAAISIRFVDIFVLPDDDSSIGQFSSANAFESASGFQTLWELALVDEGTLDNVPTVLTELTMDVVVGDGCIYDASNFEWQLQTDGLTFDAVSVVGNEVVFRASETFDTTAGTTALPGVYDRDDPDFNPLLIADNGNNTPFNILASSNQVNAAFDGLAINMTIRNNKAVPFRLVNSDDEESQTGSLLEPGASITIDTPPVINVANPLNPPDTCEDPGEGEGEGDVPLPLPATALLITEVDVVEDFFEIHNPGGETIDLNGVYVNTDSIFFEDAYYNVVRPNAEDSGGGGTGDWNVRFPANASIAPGEYLTVAVTGSEDFFDRFGFLPDFELTEDGDSPDAVPDMREVAPGSIGNTTRFNDFGSPLVLYFWDGFSDLVVDLDYVFWGDSNDTLDKSGDIVDGPDPIGLASQYRQETPAEDQEPIAPDGHEPLTSWQRADLTEGTETQTGGNGLGGADETSENLATTFCVAAPTPGAPSACNGASEGATEGEGEGAGDGEGTPEGEGEGAGDGEGTPEGEGEGSDCTVGPIHTADQDASSTIGLSELLRVIQFFNSGGFGCEAGTEDGYAPNDPDQDCCPHDSDYNGGPSWSIGLSELLRLIQFFNSGGYTFCPADGTEDGYCPGVAS